MANVSSSANNHNIYNCTCTTQYIKLTQGKFINKASLRTSQPEQWLEFEEQETNDIFDKPDQHNEFYFELKYEEGQDKLNVIIESNSGESQIVLELSENQYELLDYIRIAELYPHTHLYPKTKKWEYFK